MPRRDAIILALLAILILFSRLYSYHEPIDWDVGTYAVVAHEINNGRALYQDAWDGKPPGIFIAYALAEKFFGYGLREIYFLGATTAIATMLATYFAIARENKIAAALAACGFALISADPALDANRPNTESFINLAIISAVAFSNRPARSGLMLAIATLFKQVAFVAILPFCVLELFASNSRKKLAGISTLLFVMLSTWAIVSLYFALTGRGWLWWNTAVVGPREYAGSISQNLLESFRIEKLAPIELLALLPCAALTLVALIGAPNRIRVFLGALLIATQIEIAMPARFFIHYYQLWIAPLVLGFGWGAGVLLEIKSIRARSLRVISIAGPLALLPIAQIPMYLISPAKWASRNYGFYFEQLQPVAAEIDRTLGPGETFFNWTDEGWLYFATKRRPIGPGIWRSSMCDGPLADWMTHRTLANLKKSPPPIVVTWSFNSPLPNHPIDAWIAWNYEPIQDAGAKRRVPLVLWRRID